MALSKTSSDAYAYRLQRVIDVAGSDKINNVVLMTTAIESMPVKPATKKSYYTALYHYTELNEYRDKYMAINKVLSADALHQRLTPTEEKRWKTWDAIQELGLRVLETETVPIEERILMGLYTQLPPARLDYVNVMLVKTPLEKMSGTTIVLGTTNVCYIAEHKTTKSVGTIEHALTAPLIKVLNEYLGELDARILFESITTNALGKRVTRMFANHSDDKTPINVNVLRHSYITDQHKDEPWISDKLSSAKAMGHSVFMDELYRRKA